MARAFVLASASPRRSELLALIGVRFRKVVVDVDETPLPGERPGALAARLAREKAAAVPALDGPALVLGADTLVVVDGAILGKPADEAESRRFVGLLAGRTHEVLTAIAVRAVPEESVEVEIATSRVTFAPMSEAEIAWYAATGEGRDKAGAYALQGIGALFVRSIEGSYTNVIGLPLERLYSHLVRWGFVR